MNALYSRPFVGVLSVSWAEESEPGEDAKTKLALRAKMKHASCTWCRLIFPSNAFMAFARSLHTFNCSKKMNCELCKAVYTSIASKALVMDQYTVQ